MNETALQYIEAELTAINYLLEALWTHELVSHGYGPDDADGLGQELERQFRQLPATQSDGRPAPANDTPVRELAAARVARVFEGVRLRIASMQG